MTKIALTGHTRGLGAIIYEILSDLGYAVNGFSLSNGYDLRDYDRVGEMIESIGDHDWFINCAKPDFAQTQILYRLVGSNFSGRIINIGSPVIHKEIKWKELGLLEYVTQKVALHHAHKTLSLFYPDRLILWEPEHAQNRDYVYVFLKSVEL